jgi:geranylgeranyl pyrophosphate synthase
VTYDQARLSVRLPDILEPVQEQLRQLELRLRDARGIDSRLLEDVLEWAFAGRGKRIRPALVFLTAGFGNADAERVLNLAAAVETLHAATLIHDDLIDEADIRRGQPTLASRWGAYCAVLAGDWLFSRSAVFAAATENVRVVRIFSQTLRVMTEGELRQLFARTSLPTREHYYDWISTKTAALFAAAAEACGVLVGRPEPEIRELRTYGHELGVAFQIVDDVHDFTADEATLGKPVGSDLRSGIITLPTLCYLDLHPERRASLESMLRGRDGELGSWVDAIRHSAAVSASYAEAADHMRRALAALARLPDGYARRSLESLARFVVERPS